MKLALALSVLAAAGLASCTTYDPPPPATPVTTTSGTPVLSASSTVPAPTSAPGPRYGIIESISLVTLPASASAGASRPAVVEGPYRMTLRMDDGSIQTLIQNTRAYLVGDRIQIMSDGRLIRQ